MEIINIFGPAVAIHLAYSIACLAAIAVVLTAVETAQKIRRRHGYLRFRARYAMPFVRTMLASNAAR